jgi:two-component system sensor histidine kinase TctE
MKVPLRFKSIRQRLVVLLLLAAALLSLLLFISVRAIASASVQASQDSILGAATIAIAEELRGGEEGVAIEIPYAAFSMLGSSGEDRIFYRILVGEDTVTGYGDLPMPVAELTGLEPVFYSRDYQGDPIRLAAVGRSVLVEGTPRRVQVIVGQTRTGQEMIISRMSNRAAALGMGFFFLSAVLALLTAQAVVGPVNSLAEAVGRRGPQDLRAVTRPVPEELAPLVSALNGLMARLTAALSRTETFIAEAAHHIRTPLATLRTHAEIAQRISEEQEVLARLREILRAADDSSRSAGQLLDHATVAYRTDQRAEEDLDLRAVMADVMRAAEPTAELKDLHFELSVPDDPVPIHADRLLLESAVRNLVDNAIKYSDGDDAIELRLTVDGGTATLAILDRGRGLGTMQGRDLTRRFARGSNVSDVVGSGLGLTIVREVARALSGSFRIENREGKGACAILSLPLA